MTRGASAQMEPATTTVIVITTVAKDARRLRSVFSFSQSVKAHRIVASRMPANTSSTTSQANHRNSRPTAIPKAHTSSRR